MFVRFHLEPTAGPTLGATSRPTASTPWVPVGPAPGHRQFLSRFGSAVATSFARKPEDVLKTGREIGEVPGYTAPPCRAPPSPPEPQPPSPVPIHERLDPAVHGCVGHPPPLQLRPRDGPVTPGVAVATALGVGTTVILMERIGNIHSRRRHGVSRDRPRRSAGFDHRGALRIRASASEGVGEVKGCKSGTLRDRPGKVKTISLVKPESRCLGGILWCHDVVRRHATVGRLHLRSYPRTMVRVIQAIVWP